MKYVHKKGKKLGDFLKNILKKIIKWFKQYKTENENKQKNPFKT